MYQTGSTIKDTLDDIQRNRLVLPAIQREFVWRHEQICRLFDSLMQGYPFGTFLYWQVEAENSGNFKFFDFVREYHQRDNPHCPPLPDMPNQQLTAVLDGQQRLTALNIGLRGSMAWKLLYKRWTSSDAFPVRRFYLDLLWEPDEEEEGLKYRFAFLTSSQSKENKDGRSQLPVCWFPVSDIMSMNGGPSMVRWLNQRLPQEHVDRAYDTLDKLYRIIHSEKMVAFYREESQELEKVLQIFIRTNSGGTILSYSDLLLSVAVAQWTHHDARAEIHTLVDELNGIGGRFEFSKDLVLKAGLMLADIGSVGFNVDNFNRENMAILESKWDGVKRALILTVQLVSDFGFTEQNLRAHNAVLPIAYYLYMKNPGEIYLTHSQFKQDREAIREWLIRSLLKSGVWGSGLDTLLTALRQAINECGVHEYPVARLREVMSSRGKNLSFEDEEIEELADMQYSNRLAFALLSLLFPFIDLRNKFHVDHVFPKSRFTERRLRATEVPDDRIESFMQRANGFSNLQLLQGQENQEKRSMMPHQWLAQTRPMLAEQRQYEHDHMLGDVPESMTDFYDWYENRRAKLKEAIAILLGK